MRQDVGETYEVSRLELLRRASIHGDLDAWTAFRQSQEETVLSWFYEHPGSQAACRVQSERHFVALALSGCGRPLSRGKLPARRSPRCWCSCVRV
jgi:hypothetical protein